MKVAINLLIFTLCHIPSVFVSQIITGNINHTVTAVGQHTVNIDNDAFNDFTFEIIELSPGVYAARVLPLGGAQILDNSTFGYADALNFNDSITGNFHSNTGVLGTIANAGLFQGQGDKYLGIQLLDGGYTYKGWILLNCSANNDVLEIKSFGYQTNTNNEILAGQTIDYTSLNETQNNTLFHVYPNPSNGTITIKNLSQENCNSLRIIDAQGKLCVEKNILNQGEVSVSFNLNSGVYFLQLISENGLVVQKIIIQ
jgi:hypothetical protein